MSKFITIIRPDFMLFCKDACRSAAFNHLLFRIAGKSKDQPKEKIQAGDILWYATTEQIKEEMSDAWGVCKIRQEVNGLINMGLIGRRVNPTWGVDRTKHFCFGAEHCEKFVQLCQEHAICVVHLGLPPEVMHLIYSSNANDKSIKCTCANDETIECIQSNHQMQAIDSSDAFDKSIEAIPIEDQPKKDYQEDNKEKESNAPTPLSFSEEKKRITNNRIPIVKPDDSENDYRSHSHAAIGNATETRVFAGPLTLPSKGASHDHHSTGVDGDSAGSQSRATGGDSLTPAPECPCLSGRPVGQAEGATLFPAHPDVPLQPQASQIVSSQGDASERVLPPGSSSVVAAPASAPRASGADHVTGSSNEPPPQMALTPKAIKAQNEKRAREIWDVVQRTLKTKFSATQRKSENNTKGMENLIEDEISDDELEAALKKVPAFYVQQFNLKKFHEMIPGLTAGSSPPPQNSKPAPAPDGVQLGVSGLPIWKGRPVKYA